jgi:pyruvate,water dikinase
LLTGGKAATLSSLAAHHRVPPGFCLTARALQGVLADAVAIDAACQAPETLPSTLFNQLARAYRELAARCGELSPSVAVRSSGLDEDGQTASFAGQHESFLNVVGVEAVAKAVLRCCASARSHWALDYRRRLGLPLEGIRLAVLIQHLVPADVSAVLFSAHPVTGNRAQIVVNASWGLGTSIVGGMVTPDMYVLAKQDMSTKAREIADKRRMTIAVPGGTREVEVPWLLRTRPSLDPPQLQELARLGLALEATLGRPVDVECAYRAGRLYLLQCRPITRPIRRH